MEKAKCKSIDRSAASVLDYSFGTKDHKGREIGMSFYVWEETFAPLSEDDMERGYYSYYNIEPGKWFAVMQQTTRDKTAYGPGQRTYYLRTNEEAHSHIQKQLKAARKRYSA